MARWLALGLALVLGLAFLTSRSGPDWRPCAQLGKELKECSGIVASRRYPGVLWAHNDSGDEPRLFAVDRSGRILREVHLQGARNVDWEDLTIDDAGRLYIGDFGNNKNERHDLLVYVLQEPDPRAPGPDVLAVPVLHQLPFSFPEQHAFPDPEHLDFDCEAMYWDRGHLYVLTKHRSDTRTVLYRLPAAGEPPAARALGSAEIGSPVTSAALSPDGRRLVVLSYQYIHVFDRPEGTENFLSAPSHRLVIEGRQCEGICFLGDEVLFANEQREIYCLPLEQLLQANAYLPEPPRLRLRRARQQAAGGTDWSELTPLPLHPEFGTETAAGAAVPQIRLGWCEQGLLLRATWPLPAATVPAGEAGVTLLYLMCGPPGAAAPRLQSGQQVWEARWFRSGVELRPLLPAPGAPLPGCRVQREENTLVVEALVPLALDAGTDLALNVILRQPADDEEEEWVWAGGSSTQPLENPLLWGRAELVP